MMERVEGGLCLREVSEVLQVPEAMRCVRLCMLEAVEGGCCLLEMLEGWGVWGWVVWGVGVGGGVVGVDVWVCLCAELGAMFCMLKAVEGGLCLREVSEVLEVPEVIRRVLLCMLEAVEGRSCLLEMLDVLEVLGAVAGWAQFRCFEI